MKATALTKPFRHAAEALSPNNLANKLVEGGYRAAGPAGGTLMGLVGAAGGGVATYAVLDRLNPITTVKNAVSDISTAGSLGAKAGAILGGVGELAVDLMVPALTVAFTFESIDAAAQVWDRPQDKINIRD